jgi:tetratricopeptide (TPR) repeat protein
VLVVNRKSKPFIGRLSALLSLLLFCCFMLVAQDKTPVQRKDSVTVSAGISKEQLALEAQLAAVLYLADQALKAGRAADAVQQYEAALAMVHREPLLAEQEQKVLRKAGNGYIGANRPSDAVATFQKLVGAMSKQCDSETTAVSTCASAQQDLGMAKMHAGDFGGGLASLRQAEATYVKAEKLSKAEKASEFHEYTMIQIMNQAKTKLLTAVALFQPGKTAEGVPAMEEAIPQLNRVKDDTGISPGIRESATSSLKDAQTVLERLRLAQ